MLEGVIENKNYELLVKIAKETGTREYSHHGVKTLSTESTGIPYAEVYLKARSDERLSTNLCIKMSSSPLEDDLSAYRAYWGELALAFTVDDQVRFPITWTSLTYPERAQLHYQKLQCA